MGQREDGPSETHAQESRRRGPGLPPGRIAGPDAGGHWHQVWFNNPLERLSTKRSGAGPMSWHLPQPLRGPAAGSAVLAEQHDESGPRTAATCLRQCPSQTKRTEASCCPQRRRNQATRMTRSCHLTGRYLAACCDNTNLLRRLGPGIPRVQPRNGAKPSPITKPNEAFRGFSGQFAAAMNSFGLRFPRALWGRSAF